MSLIYSSEAGVRDKVIQAYNDLYLTSENPLKISRNLIQYVFRFSHHVFNSQQKYLISTTSQIFETAQNRDDNLTLPESQKAAAWAS